MGHVNVINFLSMTLRAFIDVFCKTQMIFVSNIYQTLYLHLIYMIYNPCKNIIGHILTKIKLDYTDFQIWDIKELSQIPAKNVH